MKRRLLLLSAALGMGLGAQSASITDLLKIFTDINVGKTMTAVSDMAKNNNVGMEAFHASGLKGGLYCSGHGVNLVSTGSLLSPKMTVEGFYNGNFDLELSYSGVFVPVSDTLTARSVKPDGTPVDYPGATAVLTPCIVLLDLIYIPIADIPYMGYSSSSDTVGLDNLCFNTVEVEDAADFILEYMPQETLLALIKAAINEQIDNEVVQNVIGSVLDRVITEDNEELYMKLLEGAKMNALKLAITKADGSKETHYYNGYELRSIEATTTVTDRLAGDTKYNLVHNYGYANKNEAADAERTYPIALSTDAEGRVSIYNFNNAGMAIHTVLTTDTIVNDSTGAVSLRERLTNTLHPVTGSLDLAEGTFSLDGNQQLSSTPALALELFEIYVAAIGNGRLVGAQTNGSKLSPSWSNPSVGAALTAGAPAHHGDNRWAASVGGDLSTSSNTVNVDLGAYLLGNGVKTRLINTDVSLKTFSSPVVYDTQFSFKVADGGVDRTHDVTLDVSEYRMTGTESIYGSKGIYIAGSYVAGEHADDVAGYDLLIAPQEIDDVKSPYGSVVSNPLALYQLDDATGLQYRYSKNLVSFSSWLTPLELGSDYDYASDGDDMTFEKFVPYTAMQKMTPSGSFVIKWNSATPTSDDTYTLFVRTRYNEESGLEPTYHALYVLTSEGEKLPTAIDAANADRDLRVCGATGVITVSGAATDAVVTVCSASGALLATAEGNARFALPQGLYVVTVDGRAFKVAVR